MGTLNERNRFQRLIKDPVCYITVLIFLVHYALHIHLDVRNFHSRDPKQALYDELLQDTPTPVKRNTIINIILHGLNSGLVVLIFSPLANDERLGIFASLLFGLHPLSFNIVALDKSVHHLLCCFFSLGAFFVFFRLAVRGGSRYTVWKWLFFALLLAAIAQLLRRTQHELSALVILVVWDLLQSYRLGSWHHIARRQIYFCLGLFLTNNILKAPTNSNDDAVGSYSNLAARYFSVVTQLFVPISRPEIPFFVTKEALISAMVAEVPKHLIRVFFLFWIILFFIAAQKGKLSWISLAFLLAPLLCTSSSPLETRPGLKSLNLISDLSVLYFSLVGSALVIAQALNTRKLLMILFLLFFCYSIINHDPKLSRYQRAILDQQLSSSDPTTLASLCQYLGQTKEYSSSLVCYERLSHINISCDHFHRIGNLQMKLGSFDSAEASLTTSLDCCNWSNPKYISTLAKLHLIRDSPNKATALLSRAKTLFPHWRDFSRLLGISYYLRNDPVAACSVWYKHHIPNYETMFCPN